MTTLATLLGSPAAVGRWELVPARSTLEFTNKTFWGLMNVKGAFTDLRGEGRIGADGTVTGRLVIKATSVQTGIGRRDHHLRSADFFDQENHPDIVVTVEGVQPGDGDEVTVRAELTIRGNTATLPLRATVDTLDDGAVRVTAKTTLQRGELGVSGNMAGMVGKTTVVSADLVFRRTEG